MKKIALIMCVLSMLVACSSNDNTKENYEVLEDAEVLETFEETEFEDDEPRPEDHVENIEETVFESMKEEIREEYKNADKKFKGYEEVGFWIYNGLDTKTQIVYNREDGRTEVYEKDKYMYETPDSAWELVSFGYWNGGNVLNVSLDSSNGLYTAVYEVNGSERIVEVQNHSNGDITKTDYIDGQRTRIYEKMNDSSVPAEIK